MRRMPAITPPPHARSSAAVDPDATLEAESVFARFGHALPDVQLHDALIHDDKGELLWRDQPASQVNVEQVLRDARDALSLGIRYPYLEFPLDANRTTVVLPAWAPDGTLAAIATLVLDTATLDRTIGSCASFLTPAVRTALKAIGSSLSGLEWPAAAPEPRSLEETLAETFEVLRPELTAPTVSKPASNKTSTAAPAAPSANSAELDRVVAAIRDEALELHVQPLARLRSSARTRRYEVLLRSRSEGDAVAPQALLRAAREHGLDSMLDRRVLSQLMAWLVRNRALWKGDIPMFSVNLSVTAISETHFFKFVDLCVRKAALPQGLIAFEITEKSCREKPECALRAIETFRGLGCPVVIDDFSMHSDVLPLIAQPGIRLVKLDPQLTIGALGDRMREARVVALVQAMRVLGMQTVAKRVEDEAEREWLTALGVDFVQSFRFMPPEPLEDWGKKKG
jgi:EAL domain-containing protein (putative c-di-GMP-specific phosphodiesterase class I)